MAVPIHCTQLVLRWTISRRYTILVTADYPHLDLLLTTKLAFFSEVNYRARLKSHEETFGNWTNWTGFLQVGCLINSIKQSTEGTVINQLIKYFILHKNHTEQWTKRSLSGASNAKFVKYQVLISQENQRLNNPLCISRYNTTQTNSYISTVCCSMDGFRISFHSLLENG